MKSKLLFLHVLLIIYIFECLLARSRTHSQMPHLAMLKKVRKKILHLSFIRICTKKWMGSILWWDPSSAQVLWKSVQKFLRNAANKPTNPKIGHGLKHNLLAGFPTFLCKICPLCLSYCTCKYRLHNCKTTPNLFGHLELQMRVLHSHCGQSVASRCLSWRS